MPLALKNQTPAFTLIPIPGMSRVRKNFEAINDGDSVSLSLERMSYIPLSVRFSLAERGYEVVRNTPAHHTVSRTVFIGNITSYDNQ